MSKTITWTKTGGNRHRVTITEDVLYNPWANAMVSWVGAEQVSDPVLYAAAQAQAPMDRATAIQAANMLSLDNPD